MSAQFAHVAYHFLVYAFELAREKQ